MMQTFLTFGLGDERTVRAVTEELTRREYRIGDARRMVRHSVSIRIREGTADQSEVEQIIARLAPDAARLPESAPATTIVGYRDGL